MAEPNAINPLMFGGSGNNNITWITASDLGLYVQQVYAHIRLQAIPSSCTYTFIGGSLPVGLTLNSSTGVVSGTMPPLSVDTYYTFYIDANHAGGSVLREFTMKGTVFPETTPYWVTEAGNVCSAGSGQYIVANLLAIDPANLPVGYRFANGSNLPFGLHFNISTGVISGDVPSVTSDTSYTFTIDATNGFVSVPRTFDITALAEPTIEWLTPAGSLTVQLQNTDFTSILLAISPSSAQITYTLETPNGLPSGLTLDSQSGVITGTLPYASSINGDVYSFVVRASDSAGLYSDRAFSITVLATTAAYDPYAADLLILMHMDGPNLSPTFIDTTGNPVTDSGEPQVSALHALFGSGSAYFDGQSRLNVVPTTEHNFDLSDTDFTIEFAALFDQNSVIGNSAFFQISDQNLVLGYDANSTSFYVNYMPNTGTFRQTFDFSWEPSQDVWTRFTVMSANSVVAVYIDGTCVGNTTINDMAAGGSSTPAAVGADNFGQTLNGYIDELRVTRAARYSGTAPGDKIPVPTKPFPDVPYWITTSPLPFGISEEYYATQLLGNDPNGDGLTFAVANGSALPATLDVTNDGHGEPSGEVQGLFVYYQNAATYTFVLDLTDGYNTVYRTFALPIKTNVPPTMRYVANGVLGTYIERYSVDTNVTAEDLNNLPLTYIDISNALANTLTLNSTTGVITGLAPPTPVTNTVDTFVIEANNGAQSAVATYTIDFIHDFPPVWGTASYHLNSNTITSSISNTQVNILYSGFDGTPVPDIKLSATDVDTPFGGNPLTYNLVSGSLPPSLILENTGTMSGSFDSENVTTDYLFTLSVSDGYNIVPALFQMNVVYCIPPIWITNSGSLANVVPLQNYTDTVYAVDVNTPNLAVTYYISNGTLPDGLLMNATTGEIFGLQTGVAQTTTFTFSIEAFNGYKSNTINSTITVPYSDDWILNPIWTTGGIVANVITGESVNVDLSIMNANKGKVTYTLESGSLPSGLYIDNTTGLITGTAPPSHADSNSLLEQTNFTFYINASDPPANTLTSPPFVIGVNDLLPSWAPDTVSGVYFGTQPISNSVSATFANPVHYAGLSYYQISGFNVSNIAMSNTGRFSGNAPDVTTNTSYAFVVNATDGVNSILGTYVINVIPSYDPVWITMPGTLINNS